MDRVKYSIIIPAYNVERYIKKCIESVAYQTYSNLEVIIVDDGSTDKTQQYINNLVSRFNNIKAYRKENGGLVSARKFGVQKSVGEYVVCIDGDDWIEKNYIEAVDKIVEKYHPEVISFEFFMDDGTKVANHVNPNLEGLYLKPEIESKIFPHLIQTEDAKYFPPNIWSKVFKREAYLDKQLKVSDKVNIGEDFAVVVPIIVEANSIYISKSAYYHYSRNQNSMTKSKKSISLYGPFLINQEIRNSIDISKFDFSNQLERKTVRSLFNASLSQFWTFNYYESRKRILNALDNHDYKDAINNANFKKNVRASVIHKLLKYRLILPIYLLSKIRKF